MKVHHLRNATLVIETSHEVILVDPMLGKAGTGMPFTLFRFKPKKNPIVELPECQDLLNRVTYCLITHLHPDHLDKEGIRFLKSKKIPVVCNFKDEKILRNKGLHIVQVLEYWKPQDFLDGKITGIPATHGYGFIAKPMGNVMGYFMQLPKEKSIYISSDTIYTNDVDKVLTEQKPDIAVVACGTAQLDLGKPLLMTLEDILKFVKKAPNKVFANHMEAVNHCPTTRKHLKQALADTGLSSKVFIPDDGGSIEY